jgi:TRAP-type C4-dicarboxylate transport system substrate-binding protein
VKKNIKRKYKKFSLTINKISGGIMNKISLGLGAILSAALIGNVASAAEKTLTVASWAGPKHAMNSTFFPYYTKQLEECSGGSLSLKVEQGMAPAPALYDFVRDGAADMTWIVHGYTPGKFVTTKLAELPGIPGNAQSISTAYMKTYEKYFAALGEAKGVETLAVFTHGPGNFNTITPVNSYKDLEGMKIRVGGGVANDIGIALGIAGVNMPAPAVYEAVSSGVANGVMFPMETMAAFKIAEIAKYTLTNPDGNYTTSFGLLLNSETYSGLSQEHRDCFDKNSGVDLATVIGGFWDIADDVGMEGALAEGVKITEANAAERAYYTEKTAHIEAKIIAEIDALGVNGAEALAYFKSEIK